MHGYLAESHPLNTQPLPMDGGRGAASALGQARFLSARFGILPRSLRRSTCEYGVRGSRLLLQQLLDTGTQYALAQESLFDIPLEPSMFTAQLATSSNVWQRLASDPSTI